MMPNPTTMFPVLWTAAGLSFCPALLPPTSIEAPGPWPIELTGGVSAPAPPPGDASNERSTPPTTTAPDEPEKTVPDEPADPLVAATDPQVVAVLDELEAGAAGLRSFTASIHYQTVNALLEEKTIHKGDVLYHVADGGRKRFAIRFDRVINNGAMRERQQDFVFSDGWFVEVDHENRQFIKRQIVRPGESFDPLKLGEGPIPLPIGQSRDAVLRRFEVTLIPLPDAGPLAKLRGVVAVHGLRLVPRPGTPEAKDHKTIDLFYDRVTRLPVGINIVEQNDNRKTARLGDVTRNPPLDVAAFERLDITVPGGDWRVDIREMGD